MEQDFIKKFNQEVDSVPQTKEGLKAELTALANGEFQSIEIGKLVTIAALDGIHVPIEVVNGPENETREFVAQRAKELLMGEAQ